MVKQWRTYSSGIMLYDLNPLLLLSPTEYTILGILIQVIHSSLHLYLSQLSAAGEASRSSW